MKYFKFYVLAFLLPYGCVTASRIKKNTSYEFKEFIPNKINGDFENNKLELWDLLNTSRKPQKILPKFSYKNSYIRLKLIDSVKIVVSLYGVSELNEEVFVSSFNLKGELKGNYFSVNKEFMFVPIPLFYYSHYESKILIGITEVDNLFVIASEIRFLWIFMSGGHNWIKENTFKRIE